LISKGAKGDGTSPIKGRYWGKKKVGGLSRQIRNSPSQVADSESKEGILAKGRVIGSLRKKTGFASVKRARKIESGTRRGITELGK